jgi:transaldolase
VKIYVDSAVVASWKQLPGCPPIQGATTNPSLVFQAGLAVNLPTYVKLVHAAGEHGLPELMLQFPSSDPSQALHWLDALRTAAARHNKLRLVVKLPCHVDWAACIRAIKQEGQALLLTAVASPVQLLWAQSMQADFVAPYVGRLQADGRDVWALIQACIAAQNGAGQGKPALPGPALLAASIKTPDVLARLIALGAAAVTLPPASLAAWSSDALTQAALDQFDQDTASSQRFQ